MHNLHSNAVKTLKTPELNFITELIKTSTASSVKGHNIQHKQSAEIARGLAEKFLSSRNHLGVNLQSQNITISSSIYRYYKTIYMQCPPHRPNMQWHRSVVKIGGGGKLLSSTLLFSYPSI